MDSEAGLKWLEYLHTHIFIFANYSIHFLEGFGFLIHLLDFSIDLLNSFTDTNLPEVFLGLLLLENNMTDRQWT